MTDGAERPDLVLVEQLPKVAPLKAHGTSLTNRARMILRDPELVYEVWSYLWEACINDEERAAVRAGNVRIEDFDEAVSIVKASVSTRKRA